jgi:hypothetical protein
VTEVEHDLDTQDPHEEVSVDAIGLVEDVVPTVETIGHIEDAQEVETIGHIDDEVSQENNGVVEEPTTGTTISKTHVNIFFISAKMGFNFLNVLLL